MPAPDLALHSCSAGDAWMRRALHDLCQPLTALECGLYIGTMSPDGVRAPCAEELLATILEALAQCERVTGQIRAMQGRLYTGAEQKGTEWTDFQQ